MTSMVRHVRSMKVTASSERFSLGGWCVFRGLLSERQLSDGALTSRCIQIEEGSARPLMKKFDVKKRVFYGNTSMEAEISLLMANQTLVRIFN